MRLVSARLVEVCQHKDLEVEFTPGLTLIIGPNGAGKSNLVNLIRASLTNDFSSMGGVKSDNVRRTRADGTPSYVESTWHVEAGVMTVRRGLANCRSTLVLNSEEVSTGKEDDITKGVLRYTGLSSAKINDFLFADQDRLQDVIAGTKGRRADLFSSLCGIEVMQLIDRSLRDMVNADRALIENFDDSRLDDHLITWASTRDAIRLLRRQIELFEGELIPKEMYDRCRNYLAQVDEFESLTRELDNARDRRRKRKNALPQVEARRDKLAAEVTDKEEEIEKLAADIAELKSRLQNASHETAAAKRFKAARATLKTPKPEPVEFDDSISEVKLQAARYKLRGRVEWIQNILDLAESGQVTHCDKCGSPIESIQDHAEEHRAELDELSLKLQKVEAKLDKHQSERAKFERYQRDLDRWETNCKSAKGVVAEIRGLYPDKPPAVVETAPLQKQLAEFKTKYDAAASELRSLRSSHMELSSKCSSMAARLVDDTNEIKKLKGKLEAMPDLSDDFEESPEDIVSHQDEITEKSREAYAQLRVKMREAKLASDEIRRLRAERRKLGRTKTWVHYADRARACLKKDRLPAKIIAAMLGRTTSAVNDYLQQLGVTYRVEAELKDFAFEAIHLDGTREPASRLSVGQKTCLAIAFWLARAEVFIGSLPFFCLDEPTAHLDQSRVSHVADLFEILSTKLYSEGRQGIVITHHQELSRVATNTIQLQSP